MLQSDRVSELWCFYWPFLVPTVMGHALKENIRFLPIVITAVVWGQMWWGDVVLYIDVLSKLSLRCYPAAIVEIKS